MVKATALSGPNGAPGDTNIYLNAPRAVTNVNVPIWHIKTPPGVDHGFFIMKGRAD